VLRRKLRTELLGAHDAQYESRKTVDKQAQGIEREKATRFNNKAIAGQVGTGIAETREKKYHGTVYLNLNMR
jgi:hypothetical protein